MLFQANHVGKDYQRFEPEFFVLRPLTTQALTPINEKNWNYLSSILKSSKEDFPGGTVDKNLPADAGDTGSIPGLGRSHMPQSN